MSIRPPEYKPPPRTTYTDLGWIFAALTGASNAPCCLDLLRRHLRLFLGLRIGLDSRLILALLVAVATIFLWPLAAVAVLYVIYSFGVHPELLIYIAAFVGIIAIAMIWWWHVGNNKP